MSDKDFKVKNKLVVNGLTGGAGPLVANSNKEIDSVAYLSTLQGGTGTTTSPSAGQVLYSAGGTTYNPTTLNTLDVKGATYSADAPSSPVVGQIWVESDTSSDSFDPNIIRRKTFTATANQTVFTTDLEFIQGYEQVFFNGMLLIRNSDYTTASNTNVTLAAGAAAGDIIEVVSITNLNSINAATTTTNTFTGNQIVNARIGVGVSDPLNDIHIYKSSGNSVIRAESAGSTGNDSGTLNLVGGSYSLQNIMYGGGGAYTISNGNAHYFGTSSSAPTVFWTGGLERMRITAAGNVGVGTASPAAKLHIDNTGGGQSPLRVKPPTGGYNALELVSGYTGNMSWGLNDAGGSGAMYFYQYDSSGSYTRTPLTIESSGTFTLSYVDASAPILYSTSNNNNKLMVFEGYAGNKWNLWGGHGGGSYFGIAENESSTPVFAITRCTNYALIGYTASQGAYKLQVNSQIFATSSSIATSDGRFKENVDTISGGLNIINSLRPVSFTWKDHPVHNFVTGKTVGFIAQEVQEALSNYDWVDNIIKTNTSDAILDEDGNEVTPAEEFLGIAESNIIPLLVAAVKELKARVETLEAN